MNKIDPLQAFGNIITPPEPFQIVAVKYSKDGSMELSFPFLIELARTAKFEWEQPIHRQPFRELGFAMRIDQYTRMPQRLYDSLWYSNPRQWQGELQKDRWLSEPFDR